ncbi:hypothetical protein [Candidatus Formimonas warabiya]|uniref:hypothetical protein n=1 Tax=Formimonas warabiya TaxID=1761012 RepID=UPI001BE4BCE8|nr:hypothetical protein [Candidatus Formimonas warabiya]
MADQYEIADNTELFYKCSKCGRMFEPEDNGNSTCPVCGNSCNTDSCKLVDGSNEDY